MIYLCLNLSLSWLARFIAGAAGRSSGAAAPDGAEAARRRGHAGASSLPLRGGNPASATPLNLGLVSEPTITEPAVAAAVDAALAAIAAATDSPTLKAVRAEHAGEASPLAALNAAIRDLPGRPESRGRQARRRRRAAGSARPSTAREAELAAAEEAEQLRRGSRRRDGASRCARARGARHPLSLLMERIGDIFIGMGWEIAEGPELENEWFNFDALNFDEDHPARAMQDTFFVDPVDSHLVLRTHTSPVQIRTLLSRDLPVYVIAPGKVFRTDELDATHTPVFHQIEGIAIDKGLTMAHLRGTLEHFARPCSATRRKIRLRPNYFPFTEPSAEMDVWQPNAKGGARWIEWGGCGMVNRNVLRAAGHRPRRVPGLRVRHGHRAHTAVPQRPERHARHGRGRHSLQPAVRNGGLMRVPISLVARIRRRAPGRDSRRRARGPRQGGLRGRGHPQLRRERTDRGRPGARVRRRAADQRQDHQLVPGAGRRARRRRRRARHRLRRPQLRRRRQGRRDPARRRCCPARSRSPRARPTATSPTA